MSKLLKQPCEIEFRLEAEAADGSIATGRNDIANMATLADVLRAWSDVIEAIALRGKPPTSPAEHKMVVRRIESGSPHRMFADAPKSHLSAVAQVARADGRPADLPSNAVPYMRTFFTVLRRANSRFHVMGNERAKIREAVLVAPREEPHPTVLAGETTFTGALLEAGGRKPNIHIDTGSGKPIVVNTDKKLARELGAHLYATIVVDVHARWDAESAELIDCTLLRWRPGPTKDFAEGVREMARHHGSEWASVDTVQWLRKLRGDDDE